MLYVLYILNFLQNKKENSSLVARSNCKKVYGNKSDDSAFLSMHVMLPVVQVLGIFFFFRKTGVSGYASVNIGTVGVPSPSLHMGRERSPLPDVHVCT